MNQTEIIALGELLIDFTGRGERQFEANPGGAPANVLAAAARLGRKTAMVGKVGTDMFGDLLVDTLRSYGVDVSHVYRTDDAFTTLAFVALDETGNRQFSFSRKHSADLQLTADEAIFPELETAKIFHCGTLSLTVEPSRSATLRAMQAAKDAGVWVSVDPNLREPLWRTADAARDAIRTVCAQADILKISDYEAEFLYGTTDPAEGLRRVCAEFAPKLAFLTCGADGAYLAQGETLLHEPCVPVHTIDTTGAGDSFVGAALSFLLDHRLTPGALTEADCRALLRFASAAASLTTTRRGGIPAMPTRAEVAALLHEDASVS